ncbi:PilZ domain-containing protein [Phyllobacterium sp. 21LDTY02-6]|uniref:PilZ domain-containing protein n=1 Tax=Phyllobacterium sp. 21LDTY02-6 TaxID=2944903 RepID=UPI002020D091|nr:PilZ domain-containing protein [Phyllobacterium sp. 21LDTY02-6]MCO4315677.1 PilZ domain-containing protein [Phyllobacterium sp. 21LDTY02-6]
MFTKTRKNGPDQRLEERKRTRLRSGKIISVDGRFIVECQFYDLTENGARIRLARKAIVPEQFWLFDDQYCGVLLGQSVWSEGMEIGIRFITPADVPPLGEAVLEALSGKYYSLGKP